MKIGIVGTGNMGRAVGIRLSHLGHEVRFGSRNPLAAEEAVKLAGTNASAGSNDDAARHGEVLIWTIREPDPARVLNDPALLDGKIVVNLNNRDYSQDVQEGAWFAEALAETMQRLAPSSHVVKALNLVGMETLDTSPEALRAAGAQLFIAGTDKSAKSIVSRLVAELGFETVDVGDGPAAVRAVEALGDVIRLLMIGQKRGGNVNLQLRALPKPNLDTIGPRGASNYK